MTLERILVVDDDPLSREFLGESLAMFERVRNLTQTPEAAITYVHRRLEESWTTHQRSLRRHGLL